MKTPFLWLLVSFCLLRVSVWGQQEYTLAEFKGMPGVKISIDPITHPVVTGPVIPGFESITPKMDDSNPITSKVTIVLSEDEFGVGLWATSVKLVLRDRERHTLLVAPLQIQQTASMSPDGTRKIHSNSIEFEIDSKLLPSSYLEFRAHGRPRPDAHIIRVTN
jgi:hypothetical protein